MILSHRIRLNPTKAQEDYFLRACGTARFTYNWALARWIGMYTAGEKSSSNSLKVMFNKIRNIEFPWTYEVHRDCTSQPFANLNKAFQSFFKKKTHYPKFKKKGQHDAFYMANDRFSLDGRRVRIPVLGWVKTREALRFTGKIVSGTVSRVANRWMLSVQVDVGDYRKSRVANEVVGVDLGLTALATFSTGERIVGPKALKKATRRLRRLSKRYARSVKGSSNRKKLVQKLARLHRRISDIRKDALHKPTTRLCRENQSVTIEDLAVKSMVKNHRFAKSLADASFGEFRRQLEYKSVIYDTEIRVADRWYPSSKMCSACGEVKAELQLSERIFQCSVCGLEIDRDLNAAINLKQLPVASRKVKPVEKKAPACVFEQVSLSSMMQEFSGGSFCSQER